MNELATLEIRASDLRKKNNYAREQCSICNKHKEIAELHHVVPLKKCAELLNSGEKEIISPRIWLCPNCHAYFHKLLYSEFTKNEEYLLLATWGETEEIRENIIRLRGSTLWT